MTISLEMIERVVKGDDSKKVVKAFLGGSQEKVAPIDFLRWACL